VAALLLPNNSFGNSVTLLSLANTTFFIIYMPAKADSPSVVTQAGIVTFLKSVYENPLSPIDSSWVRPARKSSLQIVLALKALPSIFFSLLWELSPLKVTFIPSMLSSRSSQFVILSISPVNCSVPAFWNAYLGISVIFTDNLTSNKLPAYRKTDSPSFSTVFGITIFSM